LVVAIIVSVDRGGDPGEGDISTVTGGKTT